MATKSKSSIWICQHCTTRNNIKLQRCSVCYQPRAKIQQSAPKNNGIYPALMGKKNGLNQNDILKRGPLQKKGSGVFDGWKTRYFILKQNGDFAYFADRACKNWKGNIDLQTVSKVVRKDNKNLVLHTPQRKWYLLSNNRIELDHWQQLLMFCVTTERNKKKKGNNNISNKYNKQPLPLKQSHSDNRWTKEAALNLNHKHNKNIIEGEGNGETQEAMPINNEPKNLNLPAFNPAYQMQIKDEVKDDVKEVDKMNKSSHQAQHSAIIEYYYDEGSSPAYLAKTIDMAEAKCYKNSYLCIWKIAEKACYDESEYDENEEESEEFSNSFIAGKDKDISDDDEKETLQILMGTKMNDDHSRMELYIFGGDRIIADHGPIDGAIRLFRDETAQVLDKTICGQIKQSLATDKDRQMFWSGSESKSVTYFYNMEYDYELVESYNEFKGIEHLYFRKLYWINWEDIYQYSIVYQADPQPIIIEKQKCYIHDSVCQLMLNNDVESHFRLIMTADVGNQNDQMRNDQVHNDKARDSEQEEEQGEEQEEEQEQEKAEDMMHDNNNDNDEFDPYGLASAPKMSIASFAYNSGSGLLNGDHDHLKKYRWQWDNGDDGFEDFDPESSDKIEQHYIVDPNGIFFINIKTTKYKINLKNRSQQNTKTKTTRLITRHCVEEEFAFKSVFASNGNILAINPEYEKAQAIKQKKEEIKIAKQKRNDAAVWQYLDSNGKWQNYDSALSTQIQIASLMQQSHSFFDSQGNECKIDFTIMEECKIQTNISRPIRHLSQEAGFD